MLALTSSELVDSTQYLGQALDQANQIISILEEENKRLQTALANLSNNEVETEPVYNKDIFRYNEL
tara:strand:+ start:192 stop:389 length:198 start_codon:yes stop_codon:yes gene_type:complete